MDIVQLLHYVEKFFSFQLMMLPILILDISTSLRTEILIYCDPLPFLNFKD